MTARNEWKNSSPSGLHFESDGSVANECTALDMIEHANWHPGAPHGDFLTQCLLTIVDELEIIGTALECENQDTTAHCVIRAKNRLLMAIESSRRKEQAEMDSADPVGPLMTKNGYIIPPDSILWLAPLDAEGAPNFDEATQATPEDMGQLGWIWHRSVSEAISVLTGPERRRAPQEEVKDDSKEAVAQDSQEPASETVRVAS